VPEGDTVYLAGKRLHAALAGHRLVRGELRHPRLAEQDLTGRTVLGVRSVGKHLLTRFDDGRSLHSHFRMDGSWHLYRPGMASSTRTGATRTPPRRCAASRRGATTSWASSCWSSG
jgi:formamidopyrimidine-DNA glycosylase